MSDWSIISYFELVCYFLFRNGLLFPTSDWSIISHVRLVYYFLFRTGLLCPTSDWSIISYVGLVYYFLCLTGLLFPIFDQQDVIKSSSRSAAVLSEAEKSELVFVRLSPLLVLKLLPLNKLFLPPPSSQ
jgi:hypothetical protein